MARLPSVIIDSLPRATVMAIPIVRRPSDSLLKWTLKVRWGPVDGKRQMGSLRRRVWARLGEMILANDTIAIHTSRRRGQAYLTSFTEKIDFQTYSIEAELIGTGPLRWV